MLLLLGFRKLLGPPNPIPLVEPAEISMPL